MAMNDDTAITEAELHAYVDGGLAANRRAEVETWLAAHPDQAERVAAYRRLSEELRARYQSVLAEPVPAKLMHAWRRPPRWRAAGLAAVWVAFGVALGGYGGWQLHALRTAPVALADGVVMARRAAVAHAVYSPEVRHPVEVGADQEQHLVAWLSKRLGVKVRAPNLSEAEMSLVGGRLLPGETGPVAQFMYQTERGRRLTLYVRAETGPHRETAFRYARENNVGVFYWIDREQAYAIASGDLNKEELLRAATMVYKQLYP
jgi:anti-sigma factor RsiW